MKHNILFNTWGVTVLCQGGHVISSCKNGEFAGSYFESELSRNGGLFDRLSDSCQWFGCEEVQK